MGRDNENISSKKLNAWCEKYGLSEDSVKTMLETQYPDKFIDTDKLTHRGFIDYWHITEEDQTVTNEDILGYIIDNAESKYKKFDKALNDSFANQDKLRNVVQYIFNQVKTGHDIRLSQVKESDAELREYFVLKYIVPKGDTFAQAFHKLFCNWCDDDYYAPRVHSYTDSKNDVLFTGTKCNYDDNAQRYDFDKNSSQKKENSGCFGLIAIPIIVAILLML